ncbi:MAG: hypothetical protein MZV64_50290 [Ignavibacteriales bacterium]|nr:hypothetical protein [Ignavibacteriales bacterium]
METLANVPDNLRQRRRHGISSIGTETSKGTKVFALSGKINLHRPGRNPDGNDHP